MKKDYNHKKIEYKIQNYWYKNKTFKTIEKKQKKYYCLSMLPYPSGKLHMGHVRNYTIGDIISRYQRMLGKNVLQPIGWDAFGLPAENAAIKKKMTPSEWTYLNINKMKKQLKSLGISYDWDREITTCKPEYYRWEQWFFIYLYKKKLIYKTKAIVNWCSQDKTVLANEQVINKQCWRCNTAIKLKNLKQWFIKITKYANELLNELNYLNKWPEKVKKMQSNWIGKSNGIEITFQIYNKKNKIKIYTDNINILIKVKYIILTINHKLSKKLSINNNKIKNFIKINQNKIVDQYESINKKLGIFTKLYLIHPFNNKLLPIWISNLTLNNYNTNAIMAVPNYNKNDLEFANKYLINVKLLISNYYKNKIYFKKNNCSNLDYTFNIINKIISCNIGYKKIKYRLRDWNISRQRYWGAPIPMINLKNGIIIPVKEKQLPITLPKKSSIKKNKSWIKTIYKNNIAIRETDTFDTFMESSWYYARYTCPNYNKGILNPDKTNYWLPIDQYIGGIEHAIMHLLYFRFYHKLLRDAGLVKSNEPVKKLLCQGMVLSNAYYYINNNNKKIWISQENIKIKYDKKKTIVNIQYIKNKNKKIYSEMSKMSKSKNNGIDPTKIIQKYGADTLRLFIIFTAPVEISLEWDQSKIKGVNRFLKNIWKLIYKQKNKNIINYIYKSSLNKNQKNLRHEIHSTIINVTNNIKKKQMFNIAIADIMKLTNKLKKFKTKNKKDRSVLQEGLIIIIKMLYPFAPHICFYLFKKLNKKNKIKNINWPKIDKNAILKKPKLVIIQINGKLRNKIYIKIKLNKIIILKYILIKYLIKNYLNKIKIKNLIYIKNKIINLVIKY